MTLKNEREVLVKRLGAIDDLIDIYTLPCPIQKSGVGRPRKYPFQEMGKGDSFIIHNQYTRENMTKCLNAARAWNYRGKYGYMFRIKKTEDNRIRIRRIK